MKIAMVCYPTFGGSGVVATELGVALAERGHEVHFITYKQPVRLDLLSPNIYFHEVQVPQYPLFKYQPYELALSSKLVDMVRYYGIDLMHVHYAIPHAYAGYMAKKILEDEGVLIPMVTTLHGTDITLVGNHPHYKPAVTFSINNSDKVTSVSESLKKDTLRLFSINNEIDVVPNFIDMKKHENTYTDCQRDLMALPTERIITHVSNLRPVKRLIDIVNVFAKIQDEISSKLLIVGEGPEREPAQELVDSLGLTQKVIFLGNSNEVNKILCFTDLFILPSEKESFGLAALEAMACGVPVISSNAGGLSEVNIDGVSGYLSDIGDVDDMAANAIKILKDDKTLAMFKKQAKKAAAKFDTDNVVPFYEDIYQQAIDKVVVK